MCWDVFLITSTNLKSHFLVEVFVTWMVGGWIAKTNFQRFDFCVTCWTDPQDGRKEVLSFRVFLFFSTCFKNSLYKEKFIHDVKYYGILFSHRVKEKSYF